MLKNNGRKEMKKKYVKLKDKNQSFVDITGIIDLCKDEKKLWCKTIHLIRLNFENCRELGYDYTNENTRNEDYKLMIDELQMLYMIKEKRKKIEVSIAEIIIDKYLKEFLNEDELEKLNIENIYKESKLYLCLLLLRKYFYVQRFYNHQNYEKSEYLNKQLKEQPKKYKIIERILGYLSEGDEGKRKLRDGGYLPKRRQGSPYSKFLDIIEGKVFVKLDFILEYLNIYHFHLSNSNKDELLLVSYSRDKIVLLGITSHKIFNDYGMIIKLLETNHIDALKESSIFRISNLNNYNFNKIETEISTNCFKNYLNISFFVEDEIYNILGISSLGVPFQIDSFMNRLKKCISFNVEVLKNKKEQLLLVEKIISGIKKM